MKTPKHSLRYHWARWRLQQDWPWFLPHLLLGLAALHVGSALFRHTPILWFPVLLLVLAAVNSWLMFGFKDVFEEQERRLEEQDRLADRRISAAGRNPR